MLSRYLIVNAGLTIGSAMAASAVCPTDGPLSCQNTTAVADTCCFNYPGGEILQTQFWDTDPSTGPADSWTIHGLWPDYCDGSYPQWCDSSREYTNITAILNATAPCTLKYMETYWKDYTGDDETFWEHEFGKHGTCMSTLKPSCYTDYKPQQEVADYFKRTVAVFKTLPSYKWLAAAGIVPSTTATYTLAAIQAALSANFGHDVVVNCNNNDELDELWYHFNVRGSIQTGEFVAVDPVGSGSTCPSTGIKYLPKYQTTTATSSVATATGTATTTSTGATVTTSPTPGALSGKGYFYVVSPDVPAAETAGFLISSGTWYRNGGTPATYTATPNADGLTFTMNTSKGNCAVLADSSLSCASGLTASNFSFDGTYLTYDNSSTFYADSLPSGTTQGTVYTTSKAVTLQATWSAK